MPHKESEQPSTENLVVKTGGDTFFADTKEGHRRSVVFAIAVATGSLAFMSASSAFTTSVANWPIAAVLGTVGIAAYTFGALVALGWWPSLFSDEQVFWRQ